MPHKKTQKNDTFQLDGDFIELAPTDQLGYCDPHDLDLLLSYGREGIQAELERFSVEVLRTNRLH